MMTTKRAFAPLLLCLLLASSAAAESACDADTTARLDFLETRLEDGRRHASWWWRGWLGVFATGAVVQGVRSAYEDDKGQKADYYFSVGKSLLGVFDLLRQPLAGRNGADEIRAIAADDAEGCKRRLELAEETMHQAAKQADSRYSWTRHLSGFLLNFGAGVLVAEVWDEESTGWTSFAISQTFSEAHIWTQPWRAREDWDLYRERYLGEAAAPVEPRWQLAAGIGSVGLALTF